MGNKSSELELKNKFPHFFERIEGIILESRKYNLIDRFFHFSIEKDLLIKHLISSEESQDLKLELLKYVGIIDSEISILIEKIKKNYGLFSIVKNENNTQPNLINNPELLGISPLLFNQRTWTEIIIEDIKKSDYKVEHINQLFLIIENCLNETLERLGKKDFNRKSSVDMFTLVVDDICELDNNPKSIENIIKSLKTELNSYRIPLYGKINTSTLNKNIIARFNKENIELNAITKNDIKNFIGQNFKNSKGKTLKSKELKNKLFFTKNLKHIGLIMTVLEENFTNKDIAYVLHKTFPELGEESTIKNFSSIKLIKEN